MSSLDPLQDIFDGRYSPPLFLRTSGVTIVTSERMRRPHVRIHLSDTSTEELLNLDRDAMKVPALDFLDVQGSADQKRQKLWNGHKGTPWWRLSCPLDADLLARMASYRDLVHKEVLALIPDKEPKETLYDLLRDYPCRGGKMLRPILLLTTFRNKRFPKHDETYLRMVTKKTAWYTTIAPSRLGALAAGRNGKAELAALYDVFSLVGIAFQIQDDVLNLVAKEQWSGNRARQ